jgi:hypothetical protein
VIRKSRFVAATAAALALGGATMALADGASENSVGVLGKVTPTKLDKKKFKPVQLYAGVTTSTTHAVPGQQNAEKVQLDFGKNVKFDLKAVPTCSAAIAGTTTDQAKAACPADSVIGTGVAHANLGGGPDQVSDVAVTVFNGPTANHIRLHAFSSSLGAANTQVVDADIIKSPLGGKFGQALNVSDAPDLGGDAFMLTLFDATISKGSKTVLARCGKDKNFYWQNTTTYDDGSKDVSELLSQPCKQKKSK